MHLTDLYRLEATGGKLLQHYRLLCERADASAHGSMASEAKAKFDKDWETDPQALIAAAEAEVPAEVAERQVPRRGHKASAKGEQS
jgi:hypothetical protein